MFNISYGKFWFDGDFFVRNLNAIVELRQYHSLSQRNFFSSLDRMVLLLSPLGLFFFFFFSLFFFTMDFLPLLIFPWAKIFSIIKELPRANLVKCAM